MDAVAKEKLDNKIVFYRTGWFLFMVLIVGPAWFVAPSIEGVPFAKSVGIVQSGLLIDLHFPQFLASLVSPFVTFLATFIPGSSSLLFLALAMVFSQGALVCTFLLFALVQPPKYDDIRTRLDPDWRAKENAGVISGPKIRPIRFATFMWFLLISSLVGDIFYGFYRNPIADNYVGEVFLVDGNKRKIPINAQIKLDVLDEGKIYDRRPGVHGRAFHIEFSGSGTKTLKGMGISDELFADKQQSQSYRYGTCEVNSSGTEGPRGGFLPHTWFIQSSWYKMGKSYGQQVTCPEKLHLSIEDFDTVQFGISGVSKNHVVVAQLKRKTRLSPIQKGIMQSRYNDDPDRYFKGF
jgi:hypothetical protein